MKVKELIKQMVKANATAGNNVPADSLIEIKEMLTLLENTLVGITYHKPTAATTARVIAKLDLTKAATQLTTLLPDLPPAGLTHLVLAARYKKDKEDVDILVYVEDKLSDTKVDLSKPTSFASGRCMALMGATLLALTDGHPTVQFPYSARPVTAELRENASVIYGQVLTSALVAENGIELHLTAGSGPALGRDAVKLAARYFPGGAAADTADIVEPPTFKRTSTRTWEPWEEALIPKGIEFVPTANDLPIVECAAGENSAFVAFGEPGMGKTVMIQYIAQQHGMPLLILNGNGQMTVEDLLGGMTLKDGNTVVQPAGVAQACERGLWVLVNEPNAIPAKVLQALYSILDTTALAVVGGTHLVRRHLDTRIFFTANPPGTRGVTPMPEPLMSRIRYKVFLPPPNQETFKKVLKLKVQGITDAMVTRIWNLCEGVRQTAYEQGGGLTPGSVYLRSAIALGSAARYMTLRQAFFCTILGEWQSAEERDAILKSVGSMLGA